MEIGMDDVLAVAGYRPGVQHVDVIFTNPDIGTATVPETISPIGGVLTFRTAAAVLEVVSSSAADAAAGTGARSVMVTGLDANYDIVTEVIAMNGTTAVQGAVLFYRINDVRVHTAGTGKTNAGNITVRDAGAGTTRSYIVLGQGCSEVGLFSVPRGHQMLATGWTVAARDSVGNKALADVAFYTTKDGVRVVNWRMSVDGTIPANLGSAHVFHEMTDIEVICDRVNTNASYVTFHGHGLMVAAAGTGM